MGGGGNVSVGGFSVLEVFRSSFVLKTLAEVEKVAGSRREIET